MSDKSKVIKVVTSGVPELYPDVNIYDTTLEHIKDDHPEEFSHLDIVYQTIEKPHRVHKSKTNPRSVILINEECTSASGDPLRVPIKVISATEAIMSTAYFSSSTDQGPLLWSKQDET